MLLEGQLIHLAAINADKDAETMARWYRDSEYAQLFDLAAARVYSSKQAKEHAEKELEPAKPNQFFFAIRARADDRLIGTIDLGGIRWTNGEAWLGIGIGERALWGKGYGSDALRVLLHFAFTELNLNRVSLDVFEYNPRAIRAYEKCGFKIEGRARRVIRRDGRAWDVFYMGILREEWMTG